MTRRAPIRVGIIGVNPDRGWASAAHIPALKLLPEFEIGAVVHHELRMAQAAADKFGIEKAFDSATSLGADPDIDLVVVTVKVEHHLDSVKTAIEAGKTVLVEWPLAIDLADALFMRDLARDKRVRTFVGLQARAGAPFNFVRDLISDGYVGRVLSSSLVASGVMWGSSMPEAYRYTLDPASGVNMASVTFGHSLDAILYSLGSRLEDHTTKVAAVRDNTKMIETGEEVSMNVPDQIALSGRLADGAFLNVHMRGGMSRGTNFRWEVNGAEGDIVVTSPVSYAGDGGFVVQGAHADEQLHDLPIPMRYSGGLASGISQSVAMAYQRIASDMLDGTSLSPTFDDAVELHRIIEECALQRI